MEELNQRIVQATQLLIVQAMQLPVVFLIFLFTINSTVANAINQENYKFVENLKGIFNRKNPLGFIALGFLSNLIYITLKIFDSIYSIIESHSSVAQESPTQQNLYGLFHDPLINVFNVLTTYCFLLQSVPQLKMSNEEGGEDGNQREAGDKKSFSNLTVLLVTAVAVLVVVLNWQVQNFTLSIFNFVGYLMVTIYLRNLVADYHDWTNTKARNLIIIGWLIWTLLQLWGTFGRMLEVSSNIMEIIGFSVSLLGKCFILYGLYDFSVRLGRHTNTQLRKSNSALNSANEIVNKKIEELNKTVDSINKLQELINSVSNSTDLKDLSNRVVNHLTNKRVFDFDYAIFSEINYLKQKIIYVDSKTENSKIKSPEHWVWSEGIEFDHHDIMAKVFREGELIHARREKLNSTPIDIKSVDSPLNRDIYFEYNHQNLNRFFIPVKKLKEDEKGLSKVVAIIEVGYYVEDIDFNSDDRRIKNKIEKRGELNLYIDNCAQSCERLFDQYLEEEIDSRLEKCDNLSGDNHIAYLQEILKSTCELTNAELSFISLSPTNEKNSQISIFMPDENRIDAKRKKLVGDFLNEYREITGGKFNLSLETGKHRFEKQIHEIFNTNFLQVKDIKANNITIGQLFLFNRNLSHSNNVVQSIVEKITESIGSIYNEKKFHNAVASLVTPDNAIIDLEVNMQPLINTLKDYFGTPYISIWLRGNNDKDNINVKDDKDYYIQKYASNELKNSCKKFGRNRISVDEINLEKEVILIPLNSHDTEPASNVRLEYTSFNEFGRKNNVKTLLQKPLKTQHRCFGFINIYFSRGYDHIVYEDTNFLNLISAKTLITIQIYDLVNAFRKISDSFTQNDLEITLKTITDSALKLLNADPVILFKSYNGVDVFFNDVTFSNKEEFRDKKILELFKSIKNSHVELAERIIKDGSEYFNNKKEYRDYIIKHSKVHEKIYFERDFWDRESVQSLAAVKLIHKTKNYIKPVGVMFINFRNEITFNPETMRLIETFAAFASSSIYNGLVFEKNRKFLLDNLRLTQPMLAEALTAGALHNAKKTFSAIYAFYNRLLEKIDDPYDFDNKKMNKTTIRAELEKLKVPITELEQHFYKIESLYSVAENTVIKKHDIKKILEQQIDIMEPEFDQKNIRLTRTFPSEEIYVECDESQIGQAALNLLKNAYQAMGDRGNLEVKVDKLNGEKIKIEVIDDGKGISDEIKEVMFQPNVTDKEGGSGLGLSMSKYVIKVNHSGSITGKTKDGKTTFTITFTF